jgi:NADPH:quinone reductase-like Zn-dependent oxidoreductase
MKALCVTASRGIALRDVPTPATAAPGHVLVDIAAAAINPGDKTFLARPEAAGLTLGPRRHDVWGASAAGRVVAVGEGVPADALGRTVAIYRSLGRTAETVGLWCERAQVPFLSCVRLPDGARALDYSGSLVNAITAYAFLEQAIAEGHQGAVATAGGSATGRALAALAERRGFPVVFVTRDGRDGALATNRADFDAAFAESAAQLRATAVFDGVGGALLSRLLPMLPPHATVYSYGFLAGAEPVAFPTALLMTQDLTIRRFSNFETPTVKEPARLAEALSALGAAMADPRFHTEIGKTFSFADAARALERPSIGPKAILVP